MNDRQEGVRSPLFQKYQERYARGGCTREQLERLAILGAITEEEYYEIIGGKE